MSNTLKITPKNWEQHNKPCDTYDVGWDAALDAHSSLATYLEEQIGWSADWGGLYHSWLAKFGIDPNSENGWWSLAAVQPDNLAAFIEWENEETSVDIIADMRQAQELTNAIRQIKPSKRHSVKDIVAAVQGVLTDD